MSLIIRNEKKLDVDAIRSVTELAFRDMPYASGDEQDIVDRLRAADGLAVSLVAIVDEMVVGHIAFSPAQSSDGTVPWVALGPVSVSPEYQRRGIGSALIRQGLAEIKARGALGCILVGDPEFYQRFGFELCPSHSPDKDYAANFMILCFSPEKPSGVFMFHKAFFSDLT